MSRLTACSFNRYSKRFSYSIANYDINLTLNPRRRKIQADVSVTLTAAQRIRKLCFLLADNCSLERINYLGLALPFKISQACQGLNLISAVLPIQVEAGEKIVVTLLYSWETSAQRIKSLELSPGDHWYPFSLLPDKYTCTLNVVTDESMRVLGPGEFRGVKNAGTRVRSQWVSDLPFRGIHMAGGDLLKNSRPSQPPLEVSYPRRFLNQARSIGNYCEELLIFLSEQLGPAPFPSLAIIITDNPEPSISSSFFITSISAGSLEQLKEENPGKDRYSKQYYLLAENLAHHWLKDNLAVSHPRDRLCLEGLAKYIGWQAVAAKYGKAIQEDFMLAARESILAAPRVPLSRCVNFAGGPLPPWAANKASWLMHICHSLTGEAFFPFIRENMALCTGTSPAEFFLNLGKMSGRDFSQFYKAWYKSRKQLRVEITEAVNTQDEEGKWQLAFKLINSGRLKWPYPIEIALDLADGVCHRHSLTIRKEPHLIATDAKVETLTIDPDKTLLNWADNIYTL